MRDNSRRHKNWEIVTGTKLTFIDHASQSGICSVCNKDGPCEIGKKAREGHTLYPAPFGFQFGAEKRVPNLEDLQILPELFGEGVQFSNVDTSCKLGGFEVSVPICVAAMGSTKTAYSVLDEVAAGAARAGIVMAIGENILPTYGDAGLKKMIKSYLSNYKGKGAMIVQGNFHDIKAKVFEHAVKFGAHGIEIKLGQGAKMGLGGEVVIDSKKEADKFKKLGYTIIKRADGTFERHSNPGSITKESLRESLIKYSELNVPIWIKVAAGRGIVELLEYLAELKRKENVRLEAVTIDGHGGGTGMSPWLIMNETGVPSASVLHQISARMPFDVIVAGGYNDGIDVSKGIMLGADGVAMGRSMLIAANVGKAEGVTKYLSALKEELRMVCAVLRKKKLTEMKGMRKNLYPLSSEAGRMFGI